MTSTTAKVHVSKIFPSFLILTLLITPFIVFVVLNSNTTHTGSFIYENSNFELEWWRNAESPQYITLTRIAIISYVFTLGALGSFISILTNKQIDRSGTITTVDFLILKFTGGTHSP